MSRFLRMTTEQLAAYESKRGASAAAVAPCSAPKRSKMGNRSVVWNGIKFPSGRQLKNHQAFLAQHAAGAIRGYMSEVSIRLPGTTRRVRIDHVVVQLDGFIKWYDSKGFLTPNASLKYKQIQDAYGIEVVLI